MQHHEQYPVAILPTAARGIRRQISKAFDELIASVKKAGAIARGKIKPSRVFTYSAHNIKAIRKKMGLPQSQFAALIGVNVRTLQNWEQRQRTPVRPCTTTFPMIRTP